MAPTPDAEEPKEDTREEPRREGEGAKARRRWKTWAMRFALVIGSPLLFLALVEGALLLFGYGEPTSFWLKHRGEGVAVHVSNQNFSDQFVPEHLARSPELVELPPKGEDVVRVFVLGGSAAGGDPVPEFGFPRMLEVLLAELAGGGRRFEVVNAAVTSMNSHVARHIASDCARRSPDAFVVYMGNNEVVGPYGPTAVPGAMYRNRGMIKLSIFARKTRIGQLLQSFTRREGSSEAWKGMEAFLERGVESGSQVLQHCYEHLSANLDDIIDSGLGAGAAVLVCSVPTNLPTSSPFGSSFGGKLDQGQLERWKGHFEAGSRRLGVGEYNEALEEFGEAAKIDDARADLAMAMAVCRGQLGDGARARDLYRRARDLDTLRFRADSKINDSIRHTVGRRDGDARLALLDLAESFERRAPPTSVDADPFVDHVHLSFVGNVEAALLAARELLSLLPDVAAMKDLALPEATEFVRGRLLYDEFADYDLRLEMYRRKTRPPFSGQLGHDEELSLLRDHLLNIQKRKRAADPDSRRVRYAAAVERWPDDRHLLRRLVELLMQTGGQVRGLALAQSRLDERPFCGSTRRLVVQCLTQMGRVDEALGVLASGENPYPIGEEEALHYVGTISVEQLMFDQAGELYRRLLELDEEHVDALMNLGAWANSRGRADEALEYLKAAQELAPHEADIHSNIGNAYVKLGKHDEAERSFRRAVEADPTNHLAQAGLGLRLVKLQRIEEGMERLQMAVDLMPEFATGYQILATLHRRQGELAEAERIEQIGRLFQP